MIILTLRTDRPVSELGLFDDNKQLAYLKWEAHRKLAETIHQKIQEILTLQGVTLKEIDGIIVFTGPGSFTGLRIGISVANALAYSTSSPIIGENTENWINLGVEHIINGSSDKVIVPEYGSPVRTTVQRK